MSCTKSFVKFRAYSKFIHIMGKPMYLDLIYKRRFPKTYHDGTGIIFPIGGIAFQDSVTSTTEYTKTRTYEIDTFDDALKIVENMRNGYCFKCGNVKNCKKFVFEYKDKEKEK